MFTSFSQFEDWIKDNGFKHWIIYANNPLNKSDNDRANDKILDSKFYQGDIDQKLELTRKYLENQQRTVYGLAFQTETANTGGCICEFRNSQPAQQQISALPVAAPAQQPIDEAAIASRVRKQIEAEYKERQLTEREKKLDAAEKEFNRYKASMIGTLVEYFKPVIDAKMAVTGLRKVAGVDATEDVETARIKAPEQADPEQAEQAPFTDEEADELYSLMAEFKSIEPQYMDLLRAVVKMAKAGDKTYAMAKNVLLATK